MSREYLFYLKLFTTDGGPRLAAARAAIELATIDKHPENA